MIKFKPTPYWDRNTMTLSDAITDEQWNKIRVITDELNIKYNTQNGCIHHPNKQQVIGVNIFNNYVEMLIYDSCRCHQIVDRLCEIIDLEKGQRNGQNVKQLCFSLRFV
jgi:hypothetical protein